MTIEYKSENGVGIFTINNGELNVINMEMHKEFYHHFLEFQNDDNVIVGVLTGQGSNFSAGDDLKEIRTNAWSLSNPRWDHLLLSTRRTKPVIAAMRGYALGAGFLYPMVLADIRIAGSSLKTGAPEIAYGFGGMSGPTRLALQIPAVHAAYLVLTGEKINAERAEKMNLVNEVVEDDQVMPRAIKIAQTIAGYEREAVITELDALHRGTELSRVDALYHTHQRYWLSRKLLNDDPDTGEKSLNIMKNSKDVNDA